MACGLSRFAYYGERNMWYSQQRKQGFVERLAADSHDCALLEISTTFGRRNPWYAWIKRIETWLGMLRPPVGLFAVHDYAAAIIVHICREMHLRVPEDVAVIGTGDDRTTCEFCEVPLSSVARSNQQVGYQAAALLDRLMSGAKLPKHDVLVPPEGVVERRSTEVTATDDPRVSAAISFVHKHLAEPISVRTLARALGISHRALDLTFRKGLGCTPREYIAQARVKHAKGWLAGSDNLKVMRIAHLCGFGSLRQFYAVFRRIVGVAPAEFRRRCRPELHARM
jgi:LacI family transcriptional regulator